MQIKILIVDDDLEITSTLGRVFTTMLRSYLVLTATSANAGLNILKSQMPDVVVLDVRLGPESGMDLLRDFYDYLKDQHSQYRPRFIVITAYPDEEVKKQALTQYHVDAFMMKPFDQADIKREVAKSVMRILESERKTLAMLVPKSQRDEQLKKELVDKKIQAGLNQFKPGN